MLMHTVDDLYRRDCHYVGVAMISIDTPSNLHEARGMTQCTRYTTWILYDRGIKRSYALIQSQEGESRGAVSVCVCDGEPVEGGGGLNHWVMVNIVGWSSKLLPVNMHNRFLPVICRRRQHDKSQQLTSRHHSYKAPQCCPTYPKSAKWGQDFSWGMGICTTSFDSMCVTSAHMSILYKDPYRYITRGGHIYTCCSDTRDQDQNLIGTIFWTLIAWSHR